MTKKLCVICFALVCVMLTMLVPSPVFAEEAPDTVSAETIERVYEEVLTGEITNVEDVLAVALAQYASRNEHEGIATCTMGDEPDDTPLQIVQQLEDTSDGCSQYAVSALLVLDEDNEPVTASEYAETETITGSHGMNEYSIFATHTTYIDKRTQVNDQGDEYKEYRVKRAETVLTYGTALSAMKLEHSYAFYADPFGVEYDTDNGTPINYPAAGVTYTYRPFSSSNDGWVYAVTQFAKVQTTAAIYVDSDQVFIITNPYELI